MPFVRLGRLASLANYVLVLAARVQFTTLNAGDFVYIAPSYYAQPSLKCFCQCVFDMAEIGTRFLARVICVLTVAVRLSSALVLEVSYPDSNFNKVTLRCREAGEILQNAVFFIDGDNLRFSDLVIVVNSETDNERITFTFAGARGGSLRCSYGSDTSNATLLAGKD